MLEKGVLPRDGFYFNRFTKARAFLLNKMFDITFVLLDKRGRDLN